MRNVLSNLGVPNGNENAHQNHFHISFKAPTLVPITKNLLAETEGFSTTMAVSTDDALVAPAADPIGNSGFEEEFMLDLFVAALISAAEPIAVVQAPDAPTATTSAQSMAAGQSQSNDQTFSVCQDIDGRMPIPAIGGGVKYKSGQSAFNDFGPLPRELYERWALPVSAVFSPERIAELGLKVTQIEAPKHGKAEVVSAPSFHYVYIPDKDYLGKDRVVYEIEAQGKRYKVTINFWVVPLVGRGADDVPECLNQKFNDSAIDPAVMTGQTSLAPSGGAPSPGYAVTGYMMGALPFGDGTINVSFGDLSAGAVGQTFGNAITLDTNAAGHGWFLDTTPWDNSEYVATSNPNEWIALPGSDAAGKMDLLTVLLHGEEMGRYPLFRP